MASNAIRTLATHHGERSAGLAWDNPVVSGSCSPKIQELIILPTEQCNFRCTYCYEDFKVGAMKEPVQRSIELFLNKRVPELEHLHLSWFGGEPLAARSAVLRIAGHAKDLCDQHGVSLTGGLTTNAWHLDFDLFQALLEREQRFFQITLDGFGAEHDLYRRRANGGGTFSRIWSNLLSFRRTRQSFNVQLRIHVRRESWRALDKLLGQIALEFGDDPRFAIDFEHIRNLGGDGGKTVSNPFSLSELKIVERELMQTYRSFVAEHHPKFSSVAACGAVDCSETSGPGEDAFRGESGHAVCYATKPNSLLIRADGRIGKCTVALNDKRNTIGFIKEDGTFSIDNVKLQPWIRGLASLDPMELGCPLVGMGA